MLCPRGELELGGKLINVWSVSVREERSTLGLRSYKVVVKLTDSRQTTKVLRKI